MFKPCSFAVLALKLITVSSVIPLNAAVPIVVTPRPIVSVPLESELLEQEFSNALAPIEQVAAVVPIVIELSLCVSANAYVPMLVRPVPIVSVLNELQL